MTPELLATVGVALRKSPTASPMATIAAHGTESGPGITLQATKEGTNLKVSDKTGRQVWVAPVCSVKIALILDVRAKHFRARSAEILPPFPLTVLTRIA